jgi:hypothetical protein
MASEDGDRSGPAKSVKGRRGKKKTKPKASATRRKFPRHSLSKAIRVPKAILDQNAGRASSMAEAAAFVGVAKGGPFNVEVSSALKFGLLERPETGRIQPTSLAKKILRPQSPGDDVAGLP